MTILPDPATSTTSDASVSIERPHKGRVVLRRAGEVVGSVIGDCVISWQARDSLGHVVGRDKWPSEDAAIDAVLKSLQTPEVSDEEALADKAVLEIGWVARESIALATERSDTERYRQYVTRKVALLRYLDGRL
jgi:hypothetical protein